MKNWVTYLILFNKTETISLNLDIFETNLINIILLLIILSYFLGNFLNKNLSSRQEQITRSIKDGEKSFNEAAKRLEEAKFQWAQAEIIINEIKIQTKRSKANLLDSEFDQTNQLLSQRFNNLLTLLYYREQQVLTSIKQQVSELALRRVIEKLNTTVMKEDQIIVIDNKINRLGRYL